MRLVAWNANHNVQKRSLEANAAILDSLSPDIMVISETAPPAPENPRGAFFVGGLPGLAVIAGDGLELHASPKNEGAATLSAGFGVSGRESFDLLAVWPVSRRSEPSYHQVLMSVLERFAELLSSGRAVMLGDLNSNTRVVAQRSTHPRFVQEAARLGLVSAYHRQTGEQHGDESVATYRHGSGDQRDFHLDYCFLSDALAAQSVIAVDASRDWFAIGDHRPVVLDAPL